MFLISKSDYLVKSSKKKGRGVFATRDLEAGTVLGDYLGTIIKSDSNDELKNGLYDMRGGEKYDILANPKDDGIHLINHACTNNCDAYPYKGHILYVAIRKIFKGEEILVNYGLGTADEKDITCNLHACHCGSKICKGTMHDAENEYDEWYEAWEKLLKRNFGKWYNKVPGKYGDRLQLLDFYPTFIDTTDQKIYPSIYGSETKTPAIYTDASLPRFAEIKKSIRETGRQLSFPKLRIIVYGVHHKMLFAETTS
jgi:hypothetical protein